MKMLASLSYSMLSFSKAPLKTSFSSKLTSTIKKEDLRLVRRKFLFLVLYIRFLGVNIVTFYSSQENLCKSHSWLLLSIAIRWDHIAREGDAIN